MKYHELSYKKLYEELYESVVQALVDNVYEPKTPKELLAVWDELRKPLDTAVREELNNDTY